MPRYVDAELLFFIALSIQSNEIQIIASGKLQQRTGSGDQRGRLIVLTVGGADSPIQLGNVQSCSETRADRVLSDVSGEMSRTQACRQGEPGNGLELIVDEQSCQAAGRT